MFKENKRLYDYKTILKNLKILYIEDEKSIRENITKTLQLLCGDVIAFESAEEALEYIKKESHIDIIISDICLSKMSGIEFIQQIREYDKNIPIIIISAYMEQSYLLDAIKFRLIDYLTKPIDFKTLHNALLKCTEEITNLGKYTIYFTNNTSYNVQNKTLSKNSDNSEVALTSKEVQLLEYLLENQHQVVSYDEIKDTVWDDIFEATDSALKNLLTKLRKKIGKESIKNISGIGYKLETL